MTRTDIDSDGRKSFIALRFPGRNYGTERGLFYNYFRDYDPSTGRYIESDPIGLKGGLNTYAYVEGNPLIYLDPLGLTQQDIDEALDSAKRMKPDWNFPEHIKTWEQPGKGGKTLRPIFGENEIYLDAKYLDCLSDSEATALLNSLVHELAHYNQPISDYQVDKFRERISGGNKSNAQDQADKILWDEYMEVSTYLKNRKNDSNCSCYK